MEQETDNSIRALFTSARSQRKELASSTYSTGSAYQENLQAAIASLEQCRCIADRISLFSPNETVDDISSGDLQYLLIDYYLGDLVLKDSVSDRKAVLRRAQEAYARYLDLLDKYDLLSRSDRVLYERFLEARDDFTLMSSVDLSARRETKIARLKHEKELKFKLESLTQLPHALEADDFAVREIHLAEMDLSTHNTFHALDMTAQEFKLLALMSQMSPQGPDQLEADIRERNRRRKDDYSDRLDPSMSQLLNKSKAGPILSKDGKPLQPFTLLDSRQRLRDGVFRPDHSLPTMTIDEYLEEEKRRGGMIDGGGASSTQSAQLDEDDIAKADVETMKAREWDEFTEANPKGSGNTLNRG